MFGTIVNAIAIIIGGIIGLIVKERLKEKYKHISMQVLGLAVLYLGISSAIKQLNAPDINTILFISSLVIGAVIGEALAIEDKLDQLGNFMQAKFSKSGGTFSTGFINATILYCVGTLAILGPIQAVVNHDYTILFAKSTIDFVSCIIFASTLGVGVLFSAASVLLYQGFFTLFATFIAPYLTTPMTNQISLIGGVLMGALALRMLKILDIKVANLIPALFVPVVYLLISSQFFPQ